MNDAEEGKLGFAAFSFVGSEEGVGTHAELYSHHTSLCYAKSSALYTKTNRHLQIFYLKPVFA